MGYDVILLTSSSKGDLHQYLESVGIRTQSLNIRGNGLLNYLKQIILLIRFCRNNKINSVFSHLQPVNFVSIFAQYFITARVIIFRHHLQSVHQTNENINVNANESLMDKIINRLAKIIVVPSRGVYNGMLRYEKVNENKLRIIPYIYDFSQYGKPDLAEVEKIKTQYPCKLRLLMVSRLIRLKRHHIVFPVIKELLLKGYDIKLLALDTGPEKENLDRYITENNLTASIILLGYRTDFVNYMAACDMLIQPSLTDASNSAAKEMSLFEKPIAASKNVGDYDDYIKDGENSYLIPTTDSAEHLREIIVDAYNNPGKIKNMGKKLKEEVVSRFDARNAGEVLNLYKELLNN